MDDVTQMAHNYILNISVNLVVFVVVMKMGTTVPWVGLEPTSLAFPASVLPLHPVGFPGVTTTPTPTCLQLLTSEVSADYYSNKLIQLEPERWLYKSLSNYVLHIKYSN